MLNPCLGARCLLVLVVLAAGPACGESREAELAWPAITAEHRPGCYWWWMGSAVDEANVTRQLEAYREAGIGGLHIIPIYGAKGYEDRYIEYLSPQWMHMLGHAVAEAERLDLWVDMTTGTGWCFGGPNVPEDLACAAVQVETHEFEAGQQCRIELDARRVQAVVAFEEKGAFAELTDRVGQDGVLRWEVPEGRWRLYVVSQEPAGRMVKRAAPGGGGHMLNPFCGEAVRHYLERFDEAFAGYRGPMPRAMYHDSYEYITDWSPDLLAEFEKRRGYRLEDHVPGLLDAGPPDRVARVKCDYRETLSDMMVENFIRPWTAWAHEQGCLTRNQAHGSPGNLLDLYAAADVPETEMFDRDRDPLVAKFASSAAHVAGKARVAAETGTWLREHFTTRLADLKDLVDELFVGGVNHVIYHGNCYSPASAPWPGWVFYASTQMNPRNAIWRDAAALNAYVARCQAVLQSSRPDHDVLLYWPIHDLWHNADGRVQTLTVHHTEWLTQQPVGSTARLLWRRGYPFDYVSDRQLAGASVSDGRVAMAGGAYRAVLVPPCTHMPLATMRELMRLAGAGAAVLFQDRLTGDVPGLADLEGRRRALEKLTGRLDWDAERTEAAVGEGRFCVGTDVEALLAKAGVPREPLVDLPGMSFIRRKHVAGRYYFITNRSAALGVAQEDGAIDGWAPLATPARSVVVMDPMSGQSGVAALQAGPERPEVYLQLEPGQSCILRTFSDRDVTASAWPAWKRAGQPTPIAGTWQVTFLDGGPDLPAPFETETLDSWTTLGGDEAQRFAGTARYAIAFDVPASGADAWRLELGRVAESARVRLNGQDLGVLFAPPFHVQLPERLLEATGNTLEVEVTNLAANRIRDLDRRGVEWKRFHNINFVNTGYKEFDASEWPVRDSGLLGPVRLAPLSRIEVIGKRG